MILEVTYGFSFCAMAKEIWDAMTQTYSKLENDIQVYKLQCSLKGWFVREIGLWLSIFLSYNDYR